MELGQFRFIFLQSLSVLIGHVMKFISLHDQFNLNNHLAQSLNHCESFSILGRN